MRIRLTVIFITFLLATSTNYASNCADIKQGQGRVKACKFGQKKGMKACRKVPQGDGRIIACAIGAGKIDCSKPKAKKLACK